MGIPSSENEKLKIFEMESLKLECFNLSWKLPIEVGKLKKFKNFKLGLELCNLKLSNLTLLFFQNAFSNYMYLDFLARFLAWNKLQPS